MIGAQHQPHAQSWRSGGLSSGLDESSLQWVPAGHQRHIGIVTTGGRGWLESTHIHIMCRQLKIIMKKKKKHAQKRVDVSQEPAMPCKVCIALEHGEACCDENSDS